MNVFVEPSGRRVQPFDDLIGDTPIANRPLSAWLDRAIADAGLQRIHELRAPCLVVPDNLFATGSALRAFVDAANGRDAVFVLGQSEFGNQTTPVQPDVHATAGGWRFDRIRLVADPSASSDPVEIVVDPDEKLFEIPVPRAYRRDDAELSVGIPKHAVATVHHWVHILWLSQLAGGIELRQQPMWKLVARGVAGVARARSVNKWKVLGELNTIGHDCDIHPTAILEGCTLGDGVKVGPYARMLFSAVDDGAEIMPQANLELCTVGTNAVVSQQTVLRFCVLYPEAIASQYLMQQCVLGRRALTTGGAFTLDMNFERDIRVELDGELWSSGTSFLGAAFGHDCRIGTGFWLASGRVVPNGYKLVRDPNLVLSKLPADLDPDEPLIVDGRELVPLGSMPQRSRTTG